MLNVLNEVFCFLCSICYFTFPNLKLFLSHNRNTIYCLQLLGFSMFIFTNDGKKFLHVNEVIKLEMIISGQYPVCICQCTEEQDQCETLWFLFLSSIPLSVN